MLRSNTLLAVAAVVLTLTGATLLRERPLAPAGPFGPPVQIPLREKMSLPGPASYRIEATDEYHVEALIVGRSSYRWDREADLAPIDLALAWGPLTDEQNLRGIEYSQRNRWYFYRWQRADVTVADHEIRNNSANTHILLPPNNEELRRTVMGFRRGDAVRLKGFLVNIQADDGWEWVTSRTREDSGDRSCEVFYVTEAESL